MLALLGVLPPVHGTVAIDAQGRVVYIPDEGFAGEDAFAYTVGDGQASDEGLLRVTVTDPYNGWRQGGSGNDSFPVSLRTANSVYGAGGNDTINGGNLADQLAGGPGNDSLVGLLGDDRLEGGDGNDSLGGGSGNDVLIGGRGDDALNGGWGADRFVFRRGDGHDSLLDMSPGPDAGPNGLSGDRIVLQIPGIAGFNDVLQYARQVAGGVSFDFGEGDTLFIAGVQLPDITLDWFLFT